MLRRTDYVVRTRRRDFPESFTVIAAGTAKILVFSLPKR